MLASLIPSTLSPTSKTSSSAKSNLNFRVTNCYQFRFDFEALSVLFPSILRTSQPWLGQFQFFAKRTASCPNVITPQMKNFLFPDHIFSDFAEEKLEVRVFNPRSTQLLLATTIRHWSAFSRSLRPSALQTACIACRNVAVFLPSPILA